MPGKNFVRETHKGDCPLQKKQCQCLTAKSIAAGHSNNVTRQSTYNRHDTIVQLMSNFQVLNRNKINRNGRERKLWNGEKIPRIRLRTPSWLGGLTYITLRSNLRNRL